MEELYKVYDDSVTVQISVIAATREKLKKAKNEVFLWLRQETLDSLD